jgi:hypothetical protein
MADKQPTQGMARNDRKDETDSVLIPKDTRGAGGGGPIGPKDDGKSFRGGQSNAAYHGHGQLGEQDVEGQENTNSPSKEA